jgi:hypothetical protein
MNPPVVHVNIGVWYSVCQGGDGRAGCDEMRSAYQVYSSFALSYRFIFLSIFCTGILYFFIFCTGIFLSFLPVYSFQSF